MKKTNNEVLETVETTENVIPELQIELTTEKRRRGRPIVEGSERQNRINDLAERRANGTLKLGRPKMTADQKAESLKKKALFQEFLKQQGL